MATPTSIALDDPANPERTKQFDKALEKGGVSPRNAIRELVDAYIRWVAEHDRVPTFPLSLVSADEKKKRK